MMLLSASRSGSVLSQRMSSGSGVDPALLELVVCCKNVII